MDRRQKLRVEAALPVRVWGLDAQYRPFTDLARVNNISSGGAVLQGIGRRLRAGEILEMQYAGEKVQVRVVWAGRPGTCNEGMVGVQHLPSQSHIWDVNLDLCGQVAGEG
ncbi:MAG TPA: hypothetical protein VMH85_07890 [Terriglobales bacterium]|nr:hypothetical protein [Terriglobales bacterium]